MVLIEQTAWEWPIALALAAAGTGGMVFAVITAYDLAGKGKKFLRKWGSIASVLAIIICLIAFIADLGRPEMALSILLNPHRAMESWMTRGVFILLAFLVFGILYAAPLCPGIGKWFQWLPWAKKESSLKALSLICGVLGVIVTIYSGLLIATATGIAFWNTPLLPIVWLFSGASAALGLLALIYISAERGRERIKTVHMLGLADLLVIPVELGVLFIYLDIAPTMGIAASYSVHLLLTKLSPVFILGAVVMGMVVPFIIELGSRRIKEPRVAVTASAIAAILVIVGCFLLRYAILYAGVYRPLL